MKRIGGYNADPMSQLQLTALGLAPSLGSTRWFCLPLLDGGAVLCFVLLLRGIAVLSGGPALMRLASHALLGLPSTKTAVLVEGAGDAAAAVVGILGILTQSGTLVSGHVCWLVLHTLFAAIAFPALVLLHVKGDFHRTVWELLLPGVVFALDAYLLFMAFQVLLYVAMRERVSPGVQYLIASSQRAVPSAEASCSRRHLLVAVLHDPELRGALRASGLAVERLEADVGFMPRRQTGGRLVQSPSHPLAGDLQATVEDATFLQKKAGDDKLLVSHLVLALCTDSRIEVDLPGQKTALYPVDMKHLWKRLMAMRLEGRRPQGAPGPTLLGLPLEETVAVYAALQIAGHATSLLFLALLGHSWGPLLGLREPRHLHILQLLESVVGVAAGLLGLVGVAGHRRGRWAVHEAAERLGASRDAGLDEAWNVARQDPRAAGWHKLLKRGAQWVGWLWLWTLAELFLSVPLVAMWLLESNVCGLHVDGFAHVGAGVPNSAFPGQILHCSMGDWLLLGSIAGVIALEALLCWGTLALWHEYAHGWTTTDLRGSAHFMPYSLLPEAAVLMLAGVQRGFQGGHEVDERAPLKP